MYNLRMLFVKDGTAKYISHLDLMQAFRRAFSRVGLELCYSGGFHPHMQMNILLPLSTGFSSECELLDLEIDASRAPDNLVMRLNAVLPEGICVVKIIDSNRRAGEIAFAEYDIRVEGGVDAEKINELFNRDEIVLLKRTKRGESDVNIKTLIRSFSAKDRDGGVLINAVLAAGKESLNPEYIVRAIEKYLGAEDLYTSYHRRAIFDADGKLFT